jgi:hypothetical protein
MIHHILRRVFYDIIIVYLLFSVHIDSDSLLLAIDIVVNSHNQHQQWIMNNIDLITQVYLFL